MENSRQDLKDLISVPEARMIHPVKHTHQEYLPEHSHIRSHHYHVEHLKKDFHVITMISNPVLYNSRYNLFRQFVQHMRDSGVIHLHIIEIQNGNRAFQVTQANNPYHLQLRTQDEIWIKENAINLMINRMTPNFPDFKYVAWIDGDISFMRPDWIEATINELQVSPFVQMFQTAVDLGPNGEVINNFKGFIYSHLTGLPYKAGYGHWHSGFCWAARKEELSGVGLLMDKAILGSADFSMAASLVGKGGESFNKGVHPDYKDMVLSWQTRADQFVKRNVSYVKGSIYHHWHGTKADRRYRDRWQILVKHQYSPYRHLIPDWQGVYQLDIDAWDMRDDIKRYFRERMEDKNTND